MGIVFYLLATLKHPYEIEQDIKNEDEWKDVHLSVIPVPVQKINPKLSPKISTIIQKMLEKKPENRFASWEEIRRELKTIDILIQSPHVSIIEKMISKNLQRKTEVEQKEAELTKKRMAEEQKKKIILYQFANDVKNPIKEFINSYNSANPAIEDQIEFYENENAINIKNPFINIYIHIINERDNLIKEYRDVFDDIRSKNISPTFRGKAVLAWGAVKENYSRKGFNLVLCESETTEYGDWFILKNFHNVVHTEPDNRPDPFPFELEEIKEEIRLIGMMHIYYTDVIPYDPKQIIEFISEF